MKKDLKEKAIDFKGKKYVLISDRVLFFNEEYPNGAIKTIMLSEPKDELVLFRATITPDVANPQRRFTGYSQAKWGDGYINKTSAIENAETSSVGRALAMLGIGVIDGIASIDEINKAEGAKPKVQGYMKKEMKVEKEDKDNAEFAGFMGFSEDSEVCPKCGAEMKTSKTGTKYCSALCWKNN